MNTLRIIVVEDEALVARDLQATLVKLGYEVPGVACSAEEVLELLRRGLPDLVLMDIRLGDGADGIDTARRIQEEFGVPVVYLTAYADELTIQRARETQPYGYLLKPFHESELRSVVELAAARHQAHRRLEASEAQFMNTLRSMAEGVISTDLLGRISFMNPAAEDLTAWTMPEALGRPLHEVFRISSPNGQTVDAFPGTGPEQGGKRSIVLTDRRGAVRMIEDNTAPIRDADGGLAGIVVLFRRKGSVPPQEHLADGTEAPWPNLAGIVQSIADPLLALDGNWRITYLNPQAAAILDGRREQFLGQEFWQCVEPSVHRNYYHEFSQALTRREPRSFVLELDAARQWHEVQLYPFGNGLLALLRDVTSKKEAEERERKLEKLESLGLLARGFAHDFNNLLTVLLGNLSLAEMQMADTAPGRAEVGVAKQASVQAQGLVQHLLTFARGGAPIKKTTDLAALVREWAAEWPKREGIGYQLDLADTPLPAEVDRNQILRVLHNLMRNAEQAIDRSGNIRVRAVRADKAGISLADFGLARESNAADWIVLQVGDDGEGIAAENLQRVFEPYFTTRPECNASGLGLTVCESIAKAHGASLTLASAPRRGTTVTVCLPALPSPGVAAATPGTDIAAQPASNPRILILEDEPLIRRLMVANLTSAGCTVDQTEDGADTITRYQEAFEQGQPYDLLIMDLSIPNGLGGLQAMERIQQIDPAVRAVVSSGYCDDPVMARYMDYGFRAVLPKPYQPKELRELVETLLRE
ncbi:MAG: response regulator [Verrucomicrobiales bacterium]|nr:response regulator [Verrucomicrobiales bacterium]